MVNTARAAALCRRYRERIKCSIFNDFSSLSVSRTPLLLLLAVCFALATSNKSTTTTPAKSGRDGASRAEVPGSLFPNESVGTAEPHGHTLTLPANFGKRTGDLDEMIKERTIRALVIINPIGFFYLSGRPYGLHYELLE
jgi:hypothetical protein